MQFSEFKNRIVKVKKMKLPGEDFHFKMAPLERLQELKRKAEKAKTAKTAAVLCLFYPSIEDETHFALILRKSYAGVHSAQVAFPGGKEEPEDTSLLHTALREAEEEVGVSQQTVNVLKTLTQVYIPPSNYFVQPYIGITQTTPIFVAQEDEVDTVIEVSLKEFLNDEIMIVQNLSTSYAKNIEVPAFKLQGHIVWGATAMMLNEIRIMLKEIV